MGRIRIGARRGARAALLTAALACAAPLVQAQQQPQQQPQETLAQTYRVDARIALDALMALSDDHLLSMQNALALVAQSDAARLGDWEKLTPLLAKAGEDNVPSVLWYARTDGTYWTVESGQAQQNLSDRSYFQTLLRGEPVLGKLVVSRSTGLNVAVVAVPIFAQDGRIVGALGASIRMDALSDLLRSELGLGPGQIFYAFDEQGMVAFNWRRDLIFLRPLTIPEVRPAFQEMLSRDQGIESYSFEGQRRTVLYRRSPLTRWWYAFGVARSP